MSDDTQDQPTGAAPDASVSGSGTVSAAAQAAARRSFEAVVVPLINGRRLDETVPGGYYLGVDGRPHDAEGNPLPQR